MFQGLLVLMHFFNDERHHLPHIHVRYQGQEASFSLPDGELVAGDLPKAKIRLVHAWRELRREELLADWELAVTGEALFRIDPLR